MADTASQSIHIPVLLQPTIEALNLDTGDTVFDGTFGGGGHSRAIAERIGPSGLIVATDVDEAVADHPPVLDCPLQLYHNNFANISSVLAQAGIDRVDAVLVDLGFSSDQLARTPGLSFQKNDDDLSMHLGKIQDPHTQTAADVVNGWSEEELADIFWQYGEEKASRKVAAAIVAARAERPFKTVGDLVTVIESVLPRRGKLHPATKIFQALRIVVNREFENLESFLEQSLTVLKPGGRVAVITFHSLEDRIVKQFFRQSEDQGVGRRVNKKVIAPTWAEIKTNRRARSAKLRVFEKAQT